MFTEFINHKKIFNGNFKNFKLNSKKIILSASAIILSGYICVQTAYALGLPLPDMNLITSQINSVASAASGVMTTVGNAASSAQSAGMPVATPGIGIGQALQSFESLTAAESEMQEAEQNIIINYDKLTHITDSVQNTINNLNSLNSQIKSAFSRIPQGLTSNDVSVNTEPAASIEDNINSENSAFNSLQNTSYGGIQQIVSGESQSKEDLAGKAQSLANSLILNSNGITAAVPVNSINYNCQPDLTDSGSTSGSSNDGAAEAQNCMDYVNGFESNVAASDIYNAGISSARAHKAELEGSAFENEIAGGALGNSSNYYTYQSSVLTLIAEENAADLKNMGYIESQLKQLELSKSASEIKKEHIGASLMEQNSNNPNLNFYDNTTL
ncbi:MAG: hypothetical protein EVJ46_08050 [Candidatus Acididesulfobacter guangdongensis]|uniref:Uncharacterized protein n=1 Tax=Acididesulfobacter guangdongensis TaxID=2597225 RepID=A0A519BFU1_ACIG2|nr:MAG: hypothetical protein EVJ46_08050 [Candidatus Acididesulfobacter guangdongensis]